MAEEPTVTGLTDWLERAVELLQAAIASFLVIVLIVGVVNLVATFVIAAINVELLGYKNAISIISTTVDIVLYLFIVIELYRTIIAYVAAESVVRAVVHAGLIAVVRQIITFKPGELETTQAAFMTAGSFVVLLLALLVGFYLIHRPDELE